jgi:hypothetical protein
MMHGHPVDRLVAGAIVGALVTTVIVLLFVWLDIPPERQVNLAIRLAVPFLISVCALLTRPLLHKTLLKKRRDPLLLEEDLNQLLVGRALGVVGGFFFGITLVTQLL